MVFQSVGSLWKAPGCPEPLKWVVMDSRAKIGLPPWAEGGENGEGAEPGRERRRSFCCQRELPFRAGSPVCLPAECEIFVGRVLERRGKVVAERREREGSEESEKTLAI